ncbi:MAG TPA: BON domain-containing protein [Devosia sp.]|nr:BON domain-containing protein [Devosia sp.]
MNDLDLKELVESELEFDTSLDASGIGVTVENGIVTLSGHVGTYAEKLAAEHCAARIRGVRGLAQEITVRYANHKRVADDEIAARAVRIIDWDTTIPDDAVQVKVQNGWVTLSGEVNWGFERAAAEQAVQKLGGVLGIANAITVRPHAERSDIRRRIEQAMLRDADLRADRIHVDVTGGRVTLTGTVEAWHDRSVAERAAWATPGVQEVEDRLTVL